MSRRFTIVTVVLRLVLQSAPFCCHFWNVFPPTVAGAVRVTTVVLL